MKLLMKRPTKGLLNGKKTSLLAPKSSFIPSSSQQNMSVFLVYALYSSINENKSNVRTFACLL
jgi:hypothetical protein